MADARDEDAASVSVAFFLKISQSCIKYVNTRTVAAGEPSYKTIIINTSRSIVRSSVRRGDGRSDEVETRSRRDAL